ncbi:MAG: hypothetical protein PW788_11960 [Micavibrio sp.]|nr:hypothetical protein [Micavibrio sp.]
MMTLDEFKNNIDLYSADLSRWPEADIRAAVKLMESDAAAKALLGKDVNFDDMLRRYAPAMPALSALEARIMQQVAVTPQSRETAPRDNTFKAAVAAAAVDKKSAWRPVWLFAPGSGLLAAAILGFLFGFQPQQHKGSLLDPAYYNAAQIIAADAADDTPAAYDGGL